MRWTILGSLVGVGCVVAQAPGEEDSRREPFLRDTEVLTPAPVPSPFGPRTVCTTLLDGALVDVVLEDGTVTELAPAAGLDLQGVRSLAHLGDEVIACDGAHAARFDLATGIVQVAPDDCLEAADRGGNVLVGGDATEQGRAVSEYPSWDAHDRAAPDPTPLLTSGDGALGRGDEGLLSANLEGPDLFEEVEPAAVRVYRPSGLAGDVLGVSGADGRIFAVGSGRPGVIVEQATPEAVSVDHVVAPEGELRGLSCRVEP